MQPGGKPEIGEAPEAALIRELEEELNFIVSPEELGPVRPLHRYGGKRAGPYGLGGYLSDSHQQSELYTDGRNRRSYLVYAGPGSAY